MRDERECLGGGGNGGERREVMGCGEVIKGVDPVGWRYLKKVGVVEGCAGCL